jgi:hypothetical protein
MRNKRNKRKQKNPTSHHVHDSRIETPRDVSEEANSVTPPSAPLAKAIALSLGRKKYGIQEHLVTAYKERSIQEVLFDGRMSDKAKNYSVAIKLFLFILCAFFSGLPVYKQSEDFYEIISKAWGRLTKSELQEVCRTAVDTFLKDAASKHGLGDSKPNRFDKLTHAILASFQWKPDAGHHNPLQRHLELHYTETTLCEDLFGKQQQPRDWSLETKLFLIGLRALCKQITVVAKAFGTNETAIRRINVTNLVHELVESSV